MPIKVILGSKGLVCSELISQISSSDLIFVVDRAGCSIHCAKGINNYSSLDCALRSANTSLSLFQLIVSFRSRSSLSLNSSFVAIHDAINSLHSVSQSSLLSLVFLNSVCSVRNEASQDLYYHLEKSMMSRMSAWYSNKPWIISSVDVLLHKVPREPDKLSAYIRELIDVIDFSSKSCINGSQILFYSSEINAY